MLKIVNLFKIIIKLYKNKLFINSEMDKMSQFNFKEKNEKIVMSFIASIALISTLNAADFYATVDGDKITKDDINVLLQDPRVDFDKLPQEAKSQILEGAINRKLIAKKQ